MNEQTASNKGYLREDFRLFHLRDRRAQRVETHYHEFDKVVLLISGAVEYTVEGVCYRMQPGDVLFVRHHDIHRPVISPDSDYERVILWIAPEFLERCSTAETSLGQSFALASEKHSCLYRPGDDAWLRLRRLVQGLERALGDAEFGADLLARSFFLQLMVALSRCVLGGAEQHDRLVDPKIDEVLHYINGNLSEPLGVDDLAARCYLSRYYFMRRFKETTGYTVHSYVRQKRLTLAAQRLEEGMSVTAAAMEAGFSEYSAFLRAFRKTFGVSPSEYARRRTGLDSSYTE